MRHGRLRQWQLFIKTQLLINTWAYWCSRSCHYTVRWNQIWDWEEIISFLFADSPAGLKMKRGTRQRWGHWMCLHLCWSRTWPAAELIYWQTYCGSPDCSPLSLSDWEHFFRKTSGRLARDILGIHLCRHSPETPLTCRPLEWCWFWKAGDWKWYWRYWHQQRAEWCWYWPHRWASPLLYPGRRLLAFHWYLTEHLRGLESCPQHRLRYLGISQVIKTTRQETFYFLSSGRWFVSFMDSFLLLCLRKKDIIGIVNEPGCVWPILSPVVTVMLPMSDMVMSGLQRVISGLAQLVESVSMSSLLKRKGKINNIFIWYTHTLYLYLGPQRTACWFIFGTSLIQSALLWDHAAATLYYTIFLPRAMLPSVFP